jgi:hypothetical protein
MKSTVKKGSYKSTEFPKLMEHVGDGGWFLVFFVRVNEGVVVASEETQRPVGYSDDYWYMPSFSDFQGSVTLENGT